jgi:asparagine synthase (glutamine-hydrolysing)
MCGIAGYYRETGAAEQASIQAMCDSIVHRGPDDAGYHLDGGCAIGMRRLSIIDLSTGHQPIANEDRTVWVVFNGEIYNYPEIRQDLIARGHRFETHSDTETLVHLYEEYGPDRISEAIARLRGMFAFAIWDQKRRKMLLARDRFGKKPLYYAVLPSGLYFGSELKCMRALGNEIPFELDREALELYFQFTYIPDPLSPFRAIRKLAPGGWLTYDAGSGGSAGRVKQGRYWTLPAPAEHAAPGMDRAQTAAQLRDLFDESVRIRMMADVPLGAFLSGGIDSGSVVASMARQSPEPVKTFSIGFEEAAFNELKWAANVAKKYGTEHHELLVRPDSVQLLHRLVKHFDEPFADSSAIPTLLVSEFAAQSVKVCLTGDGGDELFGGYESFFDVEKYRFLDSVPVGLRRFGGWIADRLPYSAYGKNYLRFISQPNALDRYFETIHSPYYLRKELLRPDWFRPADAAFIAREFAQCLLPNGASTLTQAMYFEATSKLTGDMLVKVDRMSMAASLEVRCPLLDHELAELAAKIPHAWKIEGRSGKRILLDAVADRLPPENLNRPKQGFGVPLVNWFRGPLKGMLVDHLTGRRFLDREIVSESAVRGLIDEHLSGRRDNYHQLWSLLMLDAWLLEWDSVMKPAAVK